MLFLGLFANSFSWSLHCLIALVVESAAASASAAIGSLSPCLTPVSFVLKEMGSVCTDLCSVSCFSVSCALFACSLALAMRVSMTCIIFFLSASSSLMALDISSMSFFVTRASYSLLLDDFSSFFISRYPSSPMHCSRLIRWPRPTLFIRDAFINLAALDDTSAEYETFSSTVCTCLSTRSTLARTSVSCSMCLVWFFAISASALSNTSHLDRISFVLFISRSSAGQLGAEAHANLLRFSLAMMVWEYFSMSSTLHSASFPS
mmetsp:Transcript_35304/g.79770  ORF Transcript_35304/g.79770 Transcript_35304/m.79770 type:complete len:262 (+) Transcript_35304:672-1457(+)